REGGRGAGLGHASRAELPVRRALPARGGRADRASPLGRRRRRAGALREDQQLQRRGALQTDARLQGAQRHGRRAQGASRSEGRLALAPRLPAPPPARLVPPLAVLTLTPSPALRERVGVRASRLRATRAREGTRYFRFSYVPTSCASASTCPRIAFSRSALVGLRSSASAASSA